MEKLQRTIATNLIYLRKKSHLTQQELATKINYSDNAISRWERGDATPTVEILSIIAHYFGVSITDLFDENFAEKDKPKDKMTNIKRILVILFSVSIVWTFALVGFIYTMMFEDQLGKLGSNGWLLFIFSIPLSCLVLYFYNRLWGNKVLHLIVFSLFWWSLITTFYLYILILSGVNLWLIFLLGIPIQLAQLLWYFIRR